MTYLHRVQSFDYQQALAERRRQDIAAWQADPAAFNEQLLKNALRTSIMSARMPNLLLLDTPEAPAAPLLKIATALEQQLGRTVYQVDCSGVSGAANVLEAITEQLTGSLPASASKLAGYDLLKHLRQHVPLKEAWPRVILQGVSEPGDVHALFGRLRDEMWELPLQWLVAGDLRHVETYVTPPACSFFEQLIPNRHVIEGVFGLKPHPYA